MNLAELESQLPSKIYFTDKERNILLKTSSYTNEVFQKSKSRDGAHGRRHWMRVAYLAGNIAAKEGINPFLPVLSGLNHDIGRVMQDERAKNRLHGQLSAEVIADFIDGLKLTREQKDLTLAAIEDHPFLNKDVRESEVVKALMDADRIDGLGAIMVVRWSTSRWESACQIDLRSPIPPKKQPGTLLAEIVRNSEYRDMFWTNTAKVIAEPRIRFMEQFGEVFTSEAGFVDRCAERLGF